jgi:hypothetical protein
MTKLGTVIFSLIGLLFLGGIALLLRLALRDTSNVKDALARAGWTLSDGSSPIVWTAQRTHDGIATSIVVKRGGVRTQTTWTEVSVPTDTGALEVLVTKQVPAMLSADGLVASFLGQKTPPKWNDGSASFRASCEAWASEPAAASRFLTSAAQERLVTAASAIGPLLGVHFADGAITARMSGELDDPKALEAVVSLVESLRP